MAYTPDKPFILFPSYNITHPLDCHSLEFLIDTKDGTVRVSRVFGENIEIEHNVMSIDEARTEWQTAMKHGWTRKQ